MQVAFKLPARTTQKNTDNWIGRLKSTGKPASTLLWRSTGVIVSDGIRALPMRLVSTCEPMYSAATPTSSRVTAWGLCQVQMVFADQLRCRDQG